GCFNLLGGGNFLDAGFHLAHHTLIQVEPATEAEYLIRPGHVRAAVRADIERPGIKFNEFVDALGLPRWGAAGCGVIRGRKVLLFWFILQRNRSPWLIRAGDIVARHIVLILDVRGHLLRHRVVVLLLNGGGSPRSLARAA